MSSVLPISTALDLSKNTQSPSSRLHHHTSAIGFGRERVKIRRQRARTWPNSCRERTQISQPSCTTSSSHLLLNEFAKGVCIPSGSPCAAAGEMDGRAPVLLFDVMGTIVRDPFYQDIPAFFGYKLIEAKLELSKYLNWTFVSCQTGKRKPDPEAFLDAAKQLGLSPSDVIFIDDQLINVEAAIQTGMIGITFQCAEKLENDLFTLGITL